MELISTKKELKENIVILENYILSADPFTREYAIARIRMGTCFVAYSSEGMMKFAPRRFIGYKNNSLTHHDNNLTKDGRVTNPAISKCLGINHPSFNLELEDLYLQYCLHLGFSPRKNGAFNVKRKYWVLLE